MGAAIGAALALFVSQTRHLADDPGLVGALTCTAGVAFPLDNEFVPGPRADHFSGS
jgi:hypothetical protein